VAIHEGNLSFLQGRKVRIRDVVGRVDAAPSTSKVVPTAWLRTESTYDILESGGTIFSKEIHMLSTAKINSCNCLLPISRAFSKSPVASQCSNHRLVVRKTLRKGKQFQSLTR
jgi:hypothetical protein